MWPNAPAAPGMISPVCANLLEVSQKEMKTFGN
jgi:hypothetical protein